jgi:hypothetical protein
MVLVCHTRVSYVSWPNDPTVGHMCMRDANLLRDMVFEQMPHAHYNS